MRLTAGQRLDTLHGRCANTSGESCCDGTATLAVIWRSNQFRSVMGPQTTIDARAVN
jgi:hypothetical protein